MSVSLLPFLLPVGDALALNGLVLFVTNVQQIRAAGDLNGGVRAAWPLMAGTLVTVPLAAQFAAGIEGATLTLILGTFVLGFVALTLASPALRVAPRHRVPAGLATGLVSGVVGGITTSPGPIFVMYVVALALPRPTHMAALGAVMALFGGLVAVSYAVAGIVRAEHLTLGALAILPALAGMALGDRMGRALPVPRFRQLVLGLLGVLGVSLIARSLG